MVPISTINLSSFIKTFHSSMYLLRQKHLSKAKKTANRVLRASVFFFIFHPYIKHVILLQISFPALEGIHVLKFTGQSIKIEDRNKFAESLIYASFPSCLLYYVCMHGSIIFIFEIDYSYGQNALVNTFSTEIKC